MAKADWVSVVPSSGSGDGSVAVSSVAEHTGREARTSAITFTAANCEDVVRNVIQAGKPEFTQFDSVSVSVGKEGGTITITGTSNSSKLTFTTGTTSSAMQVEMGDTYTANSVTTNNGAEITGDPGADAEFPFSIQLSVDENTTINELSMQLIVTDAAGNTSIITINQTAGEPYLIVEEGDINLDYLGTAVSVAVQSNTSWTVS